MALAIYRPPAFKTTPALKKRKIETKANTYKSAMLGNRSTSSASVPMDLVATRNFTGAKSKSMPKSGRSGSGPYQMLTRGRSHTDSVYPVPESKFNDITPVGTGFNNTITAANITDAGAVFTLNQLANNSGSASVRLGASIMMKSCSYRFELAVSTTTPTTCSGRVMLVWDHQSNGVAPVVSLVSDILEFPNYLSFLNIANTRRFVVLRNQQFTLTTNNNQELFFEGHCKINMMSQYIAAGTAYPNTGALLIVYISDQPAGPTTPTIKGCWRFRFKDN